MQEQQAQGRTTPHFSTETRPRSAEATAPETGTATAGVDYVALAATITLSAVSCVDLIYGDGSVALVAAGAVAGYVTRLYK